MATQLGTAFLRIRSDSTGLKESLKIDVGKAAEGLKATVEIVARSAGVREQLDLVKVQLKNLTERRNEIALTVRDKEGLAKLAAFNVKLDQIGRKSESAKIGLSGVQRAQADLLALDAALGKFGRKEETAHVKVKDTTVGGKVAGGLGGVGGIPLAVAMGLPAAINMAGVLTGIMAGLGGATVAGGAALGAFGVVAKPVLSAAKTAAAAVEKAQNKYNVAIATGTSKAKAYAAEHKAILTAYAGMSPAQIALSKQIGKMAEAWDAVKAAETPVVAGALQPWLKAVSPLIKDLAPIIDKVAPVIQNLGVKMGNLINSPVFAHFRDFVAGTGSATIAAGGGAVIKFLKGFMIILPELKPLIDKVNGGITDMGNSFLSWASSAKPRDDIKKFMTWMHDNSGRVGDLLHNVAGVLGKLATAGGVGGAVELRALSDALWLVSKIPAGVLNFLVGIAAPLLLISKIPGGRKVISLAVNVVGRGIMQLLSLMTGGAIKLTGDSAGAKILAAFTEGAAVASDAIIAAFETGGAAAGTMETAAEATGGKIAAVEMGTGITSGGATAAAEMDAALAAGAASASGLFLKNILGTAGPALATAGAEGGAAVAAGGAEAAGAISVASLAIPVAIGAAIAFGLDKALTNPAVVNFFNNLFSGNKNQLPHNPTHPGKNTPLQYAEAGQVTGSAKYDQIYLQTTGHHYVPPSPHNAAGTANIAPNLPWAPRNEVAPNLPWSPKAISGVKAMTKALADQGIKSKDARALIATYSAEIAHNSSVTTRTASARKGFTNDLIGQGVHSDTAKTLVKRYTDQITANGVTTKQKAADRARLILDLEKSGVNASTARDDVDAYTKKIDLIPKSWTTNLFLTGTGTWNVRQSGKLPTPSGNAQPNLGIPSTMVPHAAAGMLISGGIPNKDSVPILAMAGELVVPKHLVAAVAPVVAGKIPGMAAGGLVGAASQLGSYADSNWTATEQTMTTAMQGAMVRSVNAAVLAAQATANATGSTAGAMSPAAVAALWTASGGASGAAQNMARIAMAESGDIPGRVQQGQPFGLTGLGLYQITPTSGIVNNGRFGNLLNASNNTKAAISLYNASGYSPWTSDPVGAGLVSGGSGMRRHMAAGGLVGWPFPGGRNLSQLRRVDEGQDMQYPGGKPTSVLAIAPGTIGRAGPDPKGFGVSYPTLKLDQAIAGFKELYYGHTFTGPTGHVGTGGAVGHTGGAHSGGNAFNDPNWLELGFWPPNNVNGAAMHSLLTATSTGTVVDAKTQRQIAALNKRLHGKLTSEARVQTEINKHLLEEKQRSKKGKLPTPHRIAQLQGEIGKERIELAKYKAEAAVLAADIARLGGGKISGKATTAIEVAAGRALFAQQGEKTHKSTLYSQLAAAQTTLNDDKLLLGLKGRAAIKGRERSKLTSAEVRAAALVPNLQREITDLSAYRTDLANANAILRKTVVAARDLKLPGTVKTLSGQLASGVERVADINQWLGLSPAQVKAAAAKAKAAADAAAAATPASVQASGDDRLSAALARLGWGSIQGATATPGSVTVGGAISMDTGLGTLRPGLNMVNNGTRHPEPIQAAGTAGPHDAAILAELRRQSDQNERHIAATRNVGPAVAAGVTGSVRLGAARGAYGTR